jgi:hypothetical protein
MTESNKKHESRRPDYVAEKESPNYRAKNTPRAESTGEHGGSCHPVKPKAAPASAAENTDEANQKCEGTPPAAAPEKAPLAASKDQGERATG